MDVDEDSSTLEPPEQELREVQGVNVDQTDFGQNFRNQGHTAVTSWVDAGHSALIIVPNDRKRFIVWDSEKLR